MKRVVLSIAMGVVTVCGTPTSPLWSQASEIQSAAPAQPPGETSEQRGHQLLDEMVAALGGDAWLNRHDMQAKGQVAHFFRGAPTGNIVEFDLWRRYADGTHPAADRVGFLTDKSMIFPGKKIDIVQLWTDNTGYEVTYKGKATLPKEQVEDFYRRRDHSIEAIVTVWLKTPGVMVLSEGTTMVERHLADKVSVLSPTNDAVVLELDATTHLPLRRTFEWRNVTFKDHDEDREEYDDYHTIQGLPTALTLTRYHNGDMASQTFFRHLEYNTTLSPDLFNPDNLLKKK